MLKLLVLMVVFIGLNLLAVYNYWNIVNSRDDLSKECLKLTGENECKSIVEELIGQYQLINVIN
jgi:hypothetical protein